MENDQSTQVEAPQQLEEDLADFNQEEQLPDAPESPEEDNLLEDESNEEPVEDNQVEEPKPSRRESLRIQQLLSKMKEGQASQPAPQALDYSQTLNADPELIQQLEEDRRNYGEAIRNATTQDLLKTVEFRTRLEIDAPRVEERFPVLNTRSNEFNPAVADAINTMYLDAVGYNPATETVQKANIRYADFVDSVMELADSIASEKNTQTVKNVTRQAATTGLRPDGSTPKTTFDLSKPPQDMSKEELDAVIRRNLRI